MLQSFCIGLAKEKLRDRKLRTCALVAWRLEPTVPTFRDTPSEISPGNFESG
jgi:hypothetical protein